MADAPSNLAYVFVGIVGIAVGNIDRVVKVATDYFSPQQQQFQGTWLGTFKEFDEHGNDTVTRHENVKFERSSRDDDLSGIVSATQGLAREWHFSGVYDQGVYVSY